MFHIWLKQKCSAKEQDNKEWKNNFWSICILWFERMSPFEFILSFKHFLQYSEYLQMKMWFLCEHLIALLHVLKQNTLLCFLMYLAFLIWNRFWGRPFTDFPNARFCVECIYGRRSFLLMGKLSNLCPLVQKDLWCWLNMYKQSLKKKRKHAYFTQKMSRQMY